jgi:fructokinase
MSIPPVIVGLGEILWDLLPSGRQLGGAPANFAYCSHLLGSRAVIASRVGDDKPGRDIRHSLKRAGLSDECLQNDLARDTGTVRVQVNNSGQPKFEITEPVAWDFLQWTSEWGVLAESADAVCFGSLAQRSVESRNTIRTFLDTTRPNCLRVFDVNLRQSFYSAEIIHDSLVRADAVKLNHEEVRRVRKLLGMNESSDESFARALIDRFALKLVCITRGGMGSFLYDESGSHEHGGFRVTVKDTVGAGDAFTAGLVDGFLRGKLLFEMNDLANRLGAWVASHSGAMPVPQYGIRQALSELG